MIRLPCLFSLVFVLACGDEDLVSESEFAGYPDSGVAVENAAAAAAAMARPGVYIGDLYGRQEVHSDYYGGCTLTVRRTTLGSVTMTIENHDPRWHLTQTATFRTSTNNCTSDTEDPYHEVECNAPSHRNHVPTEPTISVWSTVNRTAMSDGARKYPYLSVTISQPMYLRCARAE